MTDVTVAPGFLEACWRTFILGVVQGLTEFLPISSTAHLKVVPVLLGWGDPGVAVTAVIQLGSIAAVIGFFREDLKQVMGACGRPGAAASGRPLKRVWVRRSSGAPCRSSWRAWASSCLCPTSMNPPYAA